MMTFLQSVLPAFAVGVATGMVIFLALTRQIKITVLSERHPQPQFQAQPKQQHHQQHNHQPNKQQPARAGA